MSNLSTTAGIVALAGAGVAVLALLLALVLALRLRRMRRDQRAVLGDAGARDLVSHAAGLEREFATLHEYVADLAARLDSRMAVAEDRLDSAIAHRALVRYDAYGEMSGRQSTTIALLDSTRSGLILSSIHHRDQARIYTKQVRNGEAELELSPEEGEALRLALRGESVPAGE